MHPEYAIGRLPEDHRAYRIAEAAVSAAVALFAAFARWKRSYEAARERAELLDAVRHLDEHMLRDIGLYDRLN